MRRLLMGAAMAVSVLIAVAGPASAITGDGWRGESHQMYNYGFDNFAGFPNIHDVGIVILDQPMYLPEYATLAHAGTIETLVDHRGVQDTTLRTSGYGLSYRLITPAKGPN